MKRSALVVALALLAAVFVVSATAAGKPAPKPGIHYSPVHVSIADGAAVEGKTGVLKLSVVKPFAPNAGLPDTHISYTTIAGGSAILGTDYATQHGTAMLAPGQTSSDIMVTSLDDKIYQLDHTFKVQISSTDPWVIITRSTATFTIHDNDKQPTAHLGDQKPSWVYEGGSLTWTVSLSNPSYQSVTVSLDGGLNPYSTLLPADYDGTIPTSVTIPPYQSAASFTITTHANITQSYKTMWIWMTGVANGSMPATDYVDAANQDDCWGYGTVWDTAY